MVTQRGTISLGCSASRLLTQHNQEIAQWSPDPFLCEKVGSGHMQNTINKNSPRPEEEDEGSDHSEIPPPLHTIGIRL